MLAAGAGTRFGFGGRKLLSRWRGRSLLEHVLAIASAARAEGLVETIVVVHPPAAEPIRALAERAGGQPVVAEKAADGLAESLRAGIAALPEGDAVLILLGDQPATRLETIRHLLAAADPPSRALVRPRYRAAPDRPGHPVLVGRDHWPLAREARGDRGLDPVVAAHGLSWTEVEVEGANPDIDTAGDLAALEDREQCG